MCRLLVLIKRKQKQINIRNLSDSTFKKVSLGNSANFKKTFIEYPLCFWNPPHYLVITAHLLNPFEMSDTVLTPPPESSHFILSMTQHGGCYYLFCIYEATKS